MAAVKWIVVALCSLGALGALGMGFVSKGPARVPMAISTIEVTLRPFPAWSGQPVAAPAPGAAPAPSVPVAAPTPASEPAAVAPPPADKPAEKPAEVKPTEAPKPEPVVAKPEPVAAKPEPVVAKPEPVKPAPAPVAAAKPPEPVAARPAPAPAAPPAEGLLNLRASDTADIYLDGRKLGGSPQVGVKARAGGHKVRFDCYDAAGNTITGSAQAVTVKADAEVDVDFPCPQE